MATRSAFGPGVSWDQVKATRAERGFYKKEGLIDAIRENPGTAYPVLIDGDGVIPRDDSEDARKRRQRAGVAIRRYFTGDKLPQGYKFAARVGEHQGGMTLFVGLERP
jgi:hypothetical protein